MPDQQDSPRIIPPHGGSRDLKSCQMAEIVHDATVARTLTRVAIKGDRVLGLTFECNRIIIRL